MHARIGATIELVRDVVSRDVEALNMLDKAMKRPHGGDRKSEQATIKIDNVNLDTPSGTSQTQALRKLRKDAPELHREVLEGMTTGVVMPGLGGSRQRLPGCCVPLY